MDSRFRGNVGIRTRAEVTHLFVTPSLRHSVTSSLSLLIGVFYAIIILLIIPGLAEERLGKLEALPDTIGAWCDDETSPDGVAARQEGLRRQTRLWVDHDCDWLGREQILRQVRYLDRAGRVVKTDREKRIRRRRIRS